MELVRVLLFASFLNGIKAQHPVPEFVPLLNFSANPHPINVPECSHKCARNEMLVNNKTSCAKLVVLGEQCPVDSKCKAQFSTCVHGICACLPGFRQLGTICIPTRVTCPGKAPMTPTLCSVSMVDCVDLHCSFRPLAVCQIQQKAVENDADPQVDSLMSRLDNNGFSCLPADHSPLFTLASIKRHRRRSLQQSFEYNLLKSKLILDTCPSGHVCHIHAASAVRECHIEAFGHCCPHSCPVGEPHPNASCEFKAKVPCSEQPGYECHRSFLSDRALSVFGRKIDIAILATCCPSQCPEGMVGLPDGECIPKVGPGDSCWRREQCPYTFECLQGRCQCSRRKPELTEKGWRCLAERRTERSLFCDQGSG